MFDDLFVPHERITYRDGQLLSSIDLRDDLANANRYRWLHMRYLHRTWGIAQGFEVKIHTSGTALQITPGVAIDSAGRELLLAKGVAIPALQASPLPVHVLTMRYRSNTEFSKGSDLRAVCLSGGLGKNFEQPVFAWQHPDKVRFGRQVPLAVIRSAAGQIIAVDDRVRRYTQSLVRPHSGVGITEPGRTGWRTWVDAVTETTLGLEVEVDTSAAGFTAVPQYFPTLYADIRAVIGRKIEGVPKDGKADPSVAITPGARGFISETTADHFIFRLFVSDELTPFDVEKAEWHIGWLGLQAMGGCEPSKDFALEVPFGLIGSMLVARD
jgi:hypothetical protein